VIYQNAAALRRYMTLYAVASLAVALVWGGPGAIIIPLHVQQIEFARHFSGIDSSVNLQLLNELKTKVAAHLIVPSAEQARLLAKLADFDAARARGLSIVTSMGVFMTMLVQPVIGVLSDRTRSRRGRRAPWILVGTVVSVAGMLCFPLAGSILALVIIWSVIGVGTNAIAGPLAATVPDRVPESKIGTVSAITGLGTILGLVFGALAGGALFNAFGVVGYLPFALIVGVCCPLFALGARDASSRDLQAARVGALTHLKGFTFALRDHDYRWVWIARVLLMFGYAVSTALSIYMLQSYIHPALSATEAARFGPLLNVAGLPGTLIAMVTAGRWSDRIGRRKPFVIGSSILFAFAMTIPLQWPTLTGLFIMSAISGIAMGTFIIVDQAFLIDVLPDHEAAGRDLGIGTLGTNLGQAMGPGIAGIVLAQTGSYGMILTVAIAIVLVAALAIIPVRGAR